MTTRGFRTFLVIAFMLYLGAQVDLPEANGTPPGKEDRIDKLEREVVALRHELTELRKMVANGRMWDRIRGPWRQLSHVRSGQLVVEGPFANDRDVVWRLHPDPEAADLINLMPEPDLWILGSMTLDATRDPVWVDFTKREGRKIRVIPGILKVETDLDRRLGGSIVKLERKRLHIALRSDASCTPNESGIYDERPASFESTEENGVSVYVLEPYK